MLDAFLKSLEFWIAWAILELHLHTDTSIFVLIVVYLDALLITGADKGHIGVFIEKSKMG